MKTFYFWGGLLVVIVVAFVYFRPNNQQSYLADDAASPYPSPSLTSTVAGSARYTGKILAGVSAPLIEFNDDDYLLAKASNKLVVLYFYANWCPICREEQPELLGAFNQLTRDDVVGFRVNYRDNETDSKEEGLAREFGVPYQHTKVFLKNGDRILKSPETWDKSRYLQEINKVFANP